MNKYNIHARKKRQLNRLVEKLEKLLRKSNNTFNSEIKNLIQKIKNLISELKGVLSKNKLQKILGSFAIILGVSTTTVNAQSFAPPVQNPFGFVPSPAYFTAHAFADLDNDGDMDILVNRYDYNTYGGQNFAFIQNIGSTTPLFSIPSTNPFNLDTDTIVALQHHNLIDMDNDGDLDILATGIMYDYFLSTKFKYWENIGTSSNPQFSTPIENPFGLTLRNTVNISDVIDIDGDGDYDILGLEINFMTYENNYVFFENLGTPANPQFGPEQINPFGLNSVLGSYFRTPALTDIDSDGDYDLFTVGYEGFYYFENNGNATNPQFTLPALNPFRLIADTSAEEAVIAIEISDIDLDGDMDIITGGYYGNITFYENISITPNNINNYNYLSLEIFPNPTYDKLNLSNIKNLSLVEITDQIGKKIKSIRTPKQSIDVSDLENGVYFIELIYKNQKIIRRFIKK